MGHVLKCGWKVVAIWIQYDSVWMSCCSKGKCIRDGHLFMQWINLNDTLNFVHITSISKMSNTRPPTITLRRRRYFVSSPPLPLLGQSCRMTISSSDDGDEDSSFFVIQNESEDDEFLISANQTNSNNESDVGVVVSGKDPPFLENCPTCDNTGFVKCTKCDGKGVIQNPRSVNVFYCIACVGHKKLRCPACRGKLLHVSIKLSLRFVFVSFSIQVLPFSFLLCVGLFT